MKSHGVTIQMEPLQQYFHMVVFTSYVVLTFESVDEILSCYHSNETRLAALLHGAFSFSASYIMNLEICFVEFRFWPV